MVSDAVKDSSIYHHLPLVTALARILKNNSVDGTSSPEPQAKANSYLVQSHSLRSSIMSTGKRPASGSFGSSQMVVKRPNLGNPETTVSVVNGSGNGALIQAVSLFTIYSSYCLLDLSSLLKAGYGSDS